MKKARKSEVIQNAEIKAVRPGAAEQDADRHHPVRKSDGGCQRRKAFQADRNPEKHTVPKI